MTAALLLAAEGGGMTPLHFLVFFVIFLVVVLLPVFLRRSRREKAAPSLADIRKELDSERRLRRTSDQAVVDLLETAREISAQIDTKVRILNKLVRDADIKARRLEQLLQEAGRPVPPPEPPQAPAAEADAADASAPAPETRERENAAGEGAAPSGGGEDEETPALGPRTKSGRWRSDMHERIARMTEEGREPQEIARLTHLSLGEVHLVLRLIREMDRKNSSHA